MEQTRQAEVIRYFSTLLLAHKDCNIAVGGAGIVSGMSPKGFFDEETAEQLIDATRKFKAVPPGRVEIHYDHTGFFKQVFQSEEAILDAVKSGLPIFLRIITTNSSG